MWCHCLPKICSDNDLDISRENCWLEFLNEVLDFEWLGSCLSHSIQLCFWWWVRHWCFCPACWCKIDWEHGVSWTTRRSSWLFASCPGWIWVAHNLNWNETFRVLCWNLGIHDKDEISGLVDILERMLGVVKIWLLRISERSWQLLDWEFDVISELWHPQQFANCCS